MEEFLCCNAHSLPTADVFALIVFEVCMMIGAFCREQKEAILLARLIDRILVQVETEDSEFPEPQRVYVQTRILRERDTRNLKRNQSKNETNASSISISSWMQVFKESVVRGIGTPFIVTIMNGSSPQQPHNEKKIRMIARIRTTSCLFQL